MHPTLRSLATATCILAVIPFTAAAASRKPTCTVRFHVEVRATAEDPFSIPVKVPNPPRQIFIESSASISERQVKAIHTFPAADGSWGCLFQLDDSGRLTLANLSSSSRDRSMVFYIGNEKISRLVLEILINGPVSDGLLPVPRGLTPVEIERLKTRFPVAIKPRGGQ